MQFLNFAALAGYFLIFAYVATKRPVVVFMLFPLFFYNIPNIISVFYLDFGGMYMMELGDYSKQSMATTVLAVLFACTLWVAYVFLERRYSKLSATWTASRSHNSKSPMMFDAINAVVILCITVLMVHAAVSELPIQNSAINKINFWTSGARLPFLQPINSQVVLFPLVLGMINDYWKSLGRRKTQRILNTFIAYASAIYLIFIGYKFGLPLLSLYFFYLPSLISKSIAGKFKWKKWVIFVIPIVAALLMVVVNVYTRQYGKDAVLGILTQRIFALDGQVWQAAFNDYMSGENYYSSIDQVSLELATIFGEINQLSGLQFIMHALMPSASYEHFMASDAVLTRGYPGIVLMASGSMILTAAVHIAYVIPLVLFVIFFLFSVARMDLVSAILAHKVILQIYTFTNTGSISGVLNLDLLILLFLIVAYAALKKVFKKRAYFINKLDDHVDQGAAPIRD